MKCKYCNKEIKTKYILSQTQKLKRLFCDRECKHKAQIGNKCSEETKQKMSNSASKTALRDWIKENGPWNKGIHKDKIKSNNYVFIAKPEHPYANKMGYVLEHRLVMEEKIGRYLTKKEFVHHINGDTKDNKPENLELTNIRDHPRNHRKKEIENGTFNNFGR